MMMLLRLYPKKDKEQLWNCVLPILEKCRSEHYRPLYISQWEPVEFTTVMLDVTNTECLHRLFIKELSKCDKIQYSRTLTLLSPVFYYVPKDRPKKLQRFRIALQVETQQLELVFNKITDTDSKKFKVYPTYQAYSFGEDDILISILAEKQEYINKYIQEFLAPLEGVRNIEYIKVTKSHRIIAKDDWHKYREKLYKIRTEADAGECDEDFDWSLSNVAGLTGAFIDEL